MAKSKALNTYILLDRSGSMSSLWVEAIGSINAYLTKLKEEATDEDLFTLAVFNSEGFDVLIDEVNLKSIKNIKESISQPRAMTPLFDATGKILNKALAKKAKNTAIVIMTDGEENCSKEFKKSDVQSLIKKAEAKKWEVIFLGANFDNSHDAHNLGLASAKFASMGVGKFTASMSDLAGRTRAYATWSSSINYTDSDKKKMA